jgi:hypothetical protein
MKLLLISDIHARYLPPINRTEKDFFAEAVINKLYQVLEIARQRQCRVILQAGDLFDNPNPSKYVIASLMRLFKSFDIPILTVLGQHDMVMRNFDAVNRTGTYLLEAGEAVAILGLMQCQHRIVLLDDILVHGLNFEQDFDLPVPDTSRRNILIAHASVGTDPLFPGHVIQSPREFIRKNPGYEMILVGDYHYTFEDEWKGCKIYNTGCMIRKTIKQEDLNHRPCVFVYDTETHSAEKVFLKISPVEVAFSINRAEKKDDTKLKRFIEILSEQKQLSVSFDDNLRVYYQNNQVPDAVKKLIAAKMYQVGLIGTSEFREVTK